MKKAVFIAIGLVCATAQISKAQWDDEPDQKRYVEYVGAQINPLIRQVFNFNNSNPTLVNPYLFTYSINNRRGNGIRIGVGANYTQTTTDDGIEKNETNEIDYELRLGYEKIFRIAKRWELGAGIDLVLNNMNNFTKTTPDGNFQSNFDQTQTNDLNLNYGGGPMATLRFYATKKILIGTETSIYYTRGFPTETISVDEQIPNEPPMYRSQTSRTFSSEAIFALPVAFYLVIKF